MAWQVEQRNDREPNDQNEERERDERDNDRPLTNDHQEKDNQVESSVISRWDQQDTNRPSELEVGALCVTHNARDADNEREDRYDDECLEGWCLLAWTN